MSNFIVHYWYGPNDDDVRLAGCAETLEAAQKIAAECPWDETAKICDRYGIAQPIK